MTIMTTVRSRRREEANPAKAPNPPRYLGGYC